MSNLKFKIAVALACVLLVTIATPTQAVEYNPGVSEGQWVKYGNIVGIGTDISADLNETDWMKIEVTEVSGKNVTLHMSGKYKNGTNAEESGLICNVETAATNETYPSGFVYVTAANLTENDAIATGSPFKINKTETRTYAGVSRTVNIFNVTISTTSYTSAYFMVWDKDSGMLLELEMSMTTISPPASLKMSFKAADTNIFVTGVMGWLMENIIYIVIAVVVIILIIAAVLLMRRRKPPTATTTTTTSKT